MTRLEKIMKDRDVKKITKIRIAEIIIFPTVTYGTESWTVRKKKRKKIDVFELWTWRRILRVPWTENRTECSVLEDVKLKKSLEATIFRLKLRYFGHGSELLTQYCAGGKIETNEMGRACGVYGGG
jgi:hypothetical protein